MLDLTVHYNTSVRLFTLAMTKHILARFRSRNQSLNQAHNSSSSTQLNSLLKYCRRLSFLHNIHDNMIHSDIDIASRDRSGRRLRWMDAST